MDLPIAKQRDRIIQTILENPVTIIVAETGSGKSTQVPRYLLDHGFRVMVTQPRRLAAFSVAEFVAAEYGEPLGCTIGVRTRDDKISSEKTRLLFATDGLVVMRELMGHNSEFDVLIIDEVHEWNVHIEALVALARKAITEGHQIKIVIMSATLDAERLSAYFDDAPVVTVTGRTHLVKKIKKGASIADDANALLKRGKNVLIFVPGKREIHDLMEVLDSEHRRDAVILPLHAELDTHKQQRCFKHYDRPKCIIATSVAQTSITIDDIDAVIDSGLENRACVVGGVTGLYEEVISLADAEQRRGRAGRTKLGYYIDHAPEVERDEYPVPEIMRIKLEQIALKLAMVGHRMQDIAFFHQPPEYLVRDAESTLQALGCLSPSGKVTKKGGRIALLPVSVEAGCMLLEAERLGVVDEIIPVISVFEASGITEGDGRIGFGGWRELCGDEQDSDLIAQSKVFMAIRSMPRHVRERYTLRPKAVERAEGVYKSLMRDLSEKVSLDALYGGKEAVIASIRAGLLDTFNRTKKRRIYYSSKGEKRTLQKSSVIDHHRRIVGVPWDLRPDLGGEVKSFILFATKAA